MEEACRLIINEILEGNIKTKSDLEKAKLKACREFQLEKFMSNSMILRTATLEERRMIAPVVQKKPTRTISGVAVVAVMCKPHKCPHGRCLYCPESKNAPPSYTGEEPAALRARMFDFHPYKQTYNRLLQLESIGHPLDKVELIVMGGTFPSYFLCYQEWFISKCLEAMNDFGIKNPEESIKIKSDTHMDVPQDFVYLEDVQRTNEKSPVRCVGMTFETRPDYCKIPDVDRMLNMGVTRVELGVQTIYNFIYKRIERGHTIEDVVESTRILRDSGIKVAMHLMPGLFSDFDRDMRIFKRVFSDSRFKPDMLKIYPCLVTEGSKIHEMWQKGEYIPYTTEEAVDLIVEVKKILPKWVRTMRIQRDIPSPLIEAGVKKSNLGELVYNKLTEHGANCKCIRCREVGHRAAEGVNTNFDDIKLLREEYDAGEGREIFLSFEDVKSDVLIGFLRLRMPSAKAHRKEVDSKTALLRELHVYGPMAKIGDKKQAEIWQHMGYGEQLLAEAEKIASEEYDKNKLLVISGIGARNYYKKFGYSREGPYMSKRI
ncbi:tRNA uridine(34) 5-carboxymethylaminomethyl modification radical SAM/GNAT enzyme Elp3 [Methanobacterium paludis]|uniref:tRNA carboxymethyluridine synthase n=1 Tax=Methanobacterium paludis (strain DSM 25820 / JCM 18151 / SWAN1) TaxID=868131 RepID=F6D6L3_METPW|nr:tRNA uridine(34) 5-carboxymethylaminomethyl modification radical SAM/GNAT enzyme Elp3 [Methanobacterium paludis]AEG17726.1 histone acetyltransferase, ELP3 family [Methanobacterium paludis]